MTGLVAHGVRVWCEQTLGPLLGESCRAGVGGAGRTQLRVEVGRVPLIPGRWGGTTGFNCWGPKSQGGVHLHPGTIPPPAAAAASQELGAPRFPPQLPRNGLWRSQRGGRGEGAARLFPSSFSDSGSEPRRPQPFSLRPCGCWRPPPFRGASGGSESREAPSVNAPSIRHSGQ